MKLTIFESDMGDCLLLEGDSGHLVLCDGGMSSSYRAHVRQALGALRQAGRTLDLVYVSHVDNDHISGVLTLLEDESEWRVFELHETDGAPIRPPAFPRPPEVGGILHNAFRDQVPANQRALANLLVAAVPTFYASAVPELIDAADEMAGIAAGIPEALKVSRLVQPDALDIPVNRPPGVSQGGRLLYAGRPGAEFTLGSMQFTLVGPSRKELLDLRKGWNNWIRANQARVREIRAELRRRIEEFSNGTLAGSPYDLGDWFGVPDLKGVTAPNVASLVFLVEEGGKRLLLTGDAQQDRLLAGLERIGALGDAGLHLDVLKVQHHGSDHNMDPAFARRVSADHYVFCGNGSHDNPEREVLDMIWESRMSSDASVRALAPAAQGRDFHFWFSTTSAAAAAGLKRRESLEAMESHLADLEARAGGRLHLHFNQGASIELTI